MLLYAPMSSESSQTLPTFRRHLVYWFGVCALLMIVTYSLLLEYYLDLGVNLRTQTLLERTAQDYVNQVSTSGSPGLPEYRNLVGYLSYQDIPEEIKLLFPKESLRDGVMQRRINVDLDNDNSLVPVDTQGLCADGNCALIFMYVHKISEQEWLYLVHGIIGTDDVYDALELTERATFTIGCLFAGLLILVSVLLVRSIDAPLRRLEQWTANLSVKNPKEKLTGLKYRELDSLASRFHSAFQRMHDSVENEKLFLRHASHELRTPIAILGANVELIDRLTQRTDRSDAEQAAFIRQYRAIDEIQLLMETLLWINRQSGDIPKKEPLDLRAELEETIENYKHLLEGKHVSMRIEGIDQTINQPRASVRIVLSNLVRNAFQYTTEGEVVITLEPGRISVQNLNDTDAGQNSVQAEYGFGLGLELVSLVCQKFSWDCLIAELPSGRKTTVSF